MAKYEKLSNSVSVAEMMHMREVEGLSNQEIAEKARHDEEDGLPLHRCTAYRPPQEVAPERQASCPAGRSKCSA